MSSYAYCILFSETFFHVPVSLNKYEYNKFDYNLTYEYKVEFTILVK